ncbi:MAG: TolC family protein [Tannerella sp.]|jgi:outer membrane protein TolC|nr:TolC family protein [Tannerella sp.]
MTLSGKITCLAAALYLAGALNMQAQNRLTLDSCRTLALANNRLAKSAHMQLRKAGYEVKAYRAHFLPRIYAQGMYLFSSSDYRYRKQYPLFDAQALAEAMNRTPMPDWEKQFWGQLFSQANMDLDIWLKPHHVSLSGIRFEQPVYLGGKITAAYKMAKIGHQMAQLNIVRSDAEVILQTDRAYWEYVKIRELHLAAQQYGEAVRQVADDAGHGVETGAVPENDRMKAQVKLGEARVLVREAENGLRLARMNLCMAVGLNLFDAVEPADTLTDALPVALPPDLPDLSARPEYALLNRELELKRQQINLVRSEFMPQLTLGGGYGHLNGVFLNDTKLFNQASFSAMLSLPIPLPHRIEGDNRVRSARADASLAEYRMQESADLLLLEMVKARNTLDEALLKTTLARDEYLQTEENLRVVKDRYELGMETISGLLEAQALRQEARSKHIEAKARLRIAETDYRRTTGMPILGD